MKTLFALPSSRSLRRSLPILLGIALSGVTVSSIADARIAVPTESAIVVQQQPKIQLAILLDTSSSMDGLIDQARNQLWQVVNEFSRTEKNGKTPTLEVAVYEYGNSHLSAKSGYIRQVVSLTSELDKVSEALFSLTTSGGDEYCGYAIRTASTDLQWSSTADDIKAIFIAGNEPFTQGPVAYKTAVLAAKEKGITVNTIHAGAYELGLSSGWQHGASLAGGNYMSIDHNHQVAHIITPQDSELVALNNQLNNTYIPYGKRGHSSALRQREQDSKNSKVSVGLMAKRAVSKASSMYKNEGWDLVDAWTSKRVKLKDLDDKALPAKMQAMNLQEKKDYVRNKQQQRQQLQEKIRALSVARDQYVAKEKAAAPTAEASTMHDALSASIRKESEQKGFILKQK